MKQRLPERSLATFRTKAITATSLLLLVLGVVVVWLGRSFPTLDLISVAAPLFLGLATTVLLLALLLRATLAFVAALAAALVWGVMVAPDVVAGPDPMPPRGQKVRIVSFNAFRDNDRPAEAREQLIRLEPDLLLMQEAGGVLDGASAEWLAHFPFRSQCIPGCDLAILSRMPTGRPRYRFRNSEGLPVGSRLVQAEVLPGSPESFVAVTVHLSRPYRDPVGARRELTELAATLAPHQNGALILGGDFNVPPWTRGLRMFDQAVTPMLVRADRTQPSYPTNADVLGLPLPPMLPIDHVYAGLQWTVVGRETVLLPGSDHLAIVIDVVRN